MKELIQDSSSNTWSDCIFYNFSKASLWVTQYLHMQKHFVCAWAQFAYYRRNHSSIYAGFEMKTMTTEKQANERCLETRGRGPLLHQLIDRSVDMRNYRSILIWASICSRGGRNLIDLKVYHNCNKRSIGRNLASQLWYTCAFDLTTTTCALMLGYLKACPRVIDW